MKYTKKELLSKIKTFISKNKDLYLYDFASDLDSIDKHRCSRNTINCWKIRRNGVIIIQNNLSNLNNHCIFKITKDCRLESLLQSNLNRLFLSILICDEEDKI